MNPLLRQHLGSIVSAALAAVDARRATSLGLGNLGEVLLRERHVYVVAAGKASVGMARAVDDFFNVQFTAGLMTAVVTDDPGRGWTAIPATHPTPSSASETAGRMALSMADNARISGGLLLVCLSGGASAMLAVPAAGLTIDDKVAATRTLLRAGLDIGELNVVRRHLSAIKGGQLAARAGRSVTLAISDVCTPVEDDPKVIGSGPTSPDDSTFEEALAVIERHRVADGLPKVVMAHLEAGARGEAVGPVASGDPRLREASYWLVASRHDAMRAAADAARRLGYSVQVVRAPVVGEARVAHAVLLAGLAGAGRPACVISSGETTVRVTGSGRGGRNQELALAAIEPLAGLGTAALASVGTDGIDGPTDAAGALVDSGLWAALGPDAAKQVEAALSENNAYPILDRLGALVRTGPTGTNVGDLQVVLLP